MEARKRWPRLGLMLVLGLLPALATAGRGGQAGEAAAAGPPPMPSYAYLEISPQIPQPYDTSRYVRLWWEMPPGTREQVTYYILESALDPEFRVFPSSYVLPAIQFGLDQPQTLVGIPEGDGVAYYYRVWACNDAGCSLPRWAGVVARRVWPDPGSWNFYAACSWAPGWSERAGGLVPMFMCNVRTLSPIAPCDWIFYDGIAGFGGTVHMTTPHACVVPTAPAGTAWPDMWPPPWVSVGQRFGPWEAAVAIRLPGL